MEKTHEFICDRCKQNKTYTSSFTTGYGIDGDGNKVCYQCCADEDRQWMIDRGQISLYLTFKDGIPTKISNWPGSLTFKVGTWKKGRHNWGIPRYDVWFRGPDNKCWWGKFIGYNHEIVHCKRTKWE